jgi:hypothetical protein
MRLFLSLAFLFLVSCVVYETEVEPIEYEEQSESLISVESPVKAHLQDGSTIVYPKGITIEDGIVKGQGFKYDITLGHSEPVTEVNLDEVAAMETYQNQVNAVSTVVGSTAATAGAVVVSAALAVAIFGSCPTTYSLEGVEPILEAESFSYSIAPGFEARDVDRLGIKPGPRGTVELEIRNEALETHYINHIELMEVVHSDAESVFPDPKGHPIVVGSLRAPDVVTDRSGRRIDSIVGAADGKAWRTDAVRLQNVSADDMEDYVDLEFDMPTAGREAALVLRLRNSLLNTVLFYDVMLKGQGFRALDWMGEDLGRLGPKYKLASWYRKKMGMRVSIWDKGRYMQVATIGDTGPIAWDELAIPLPAVKGKKLRIRLSFVADNWRIDYLALATKVRNAKARKIPVAKVTGAAGDELSQARKNLHAADAAYVITKPGEYIRLRFDVGAAPHDLKRTYFLAAEGYYIEWMRKDWLESTSASTFVPNDTSLQAALLTALHLWAPQREAFREQFESTRINTR